MGTALIYNSKTQTYLGGYVYLRQSVTKQMWDSLLPTGQFLFPYKCFNVRWVDTHSAQ
jgi:hypothetical protein